MTSDPGMDIKMTSQGLKDLASWLSGQGGDESAVDNLLHFVQQRWDCADFRVITLLKLLYRVPPTTAPEGLWQRIDATLLGFRYWMDEPGQDSMCFWSENHQVLFFTCALLAGQRHPDAVFTNSGRTGRMQVARATTRLHRWLDARFRYGYTEWNSSTYYEEDAAALAMLIDHSQDESLRTKATIALDLLFLDLALHGSLTRMQASAGRAYERQTQHPQTADVNDLLRWGFTDTTDGFDLERMSGVVVTSTYRVPEAIRAIARDTNRVSVRTSAGLDLHEVAAHVGPALELESTGLQMWLQEAFTTPESIEVTMKALRTWDLDDNRFLQPLTRFQPLARTGILPGLIRLLNPATQGVAIQRADVVTHRTPHTRLSSAQRHHPGGFGDQQLIWIAALPGDVSVYATHPAEPMFDSTERNFSPSQWVGNGIMPDVAQADDVLLAVYDTTVRGGYLERNRQHRSHLFWPQGRFDEVIVDKRALMGRAATGYVAALATSDLEPESEDAYAQRGGITAWAIMVSDADRESFHDFVKRVGGATLRRKRDTTVLNIPGASYELRAGGDFTVDGIPHGGPHPRFDSPWVTAPRFPESIQVRAGGHHLLLDASRLVRECR